VFQEVQGIEFDSLHWSLLNDRSLMERSLARIGNTYGRLTEAVGRQNVHLELQFNKLPAQHLVNRAIIEFARRENLTDKLIVTCDSHYARPEYWREREIYKKLGRMNFETFDPESIPKSKEGLKCELYPKNAIQVWETYKETGGGASFYEDTLVKEAIERTWHIAHEDIGDIQPDREVKLPSYVIPEGKTATQGLAQAVVEGLKKKGLQSDPVYVNRAKYELSIIRDKNFSEYFLTMKEIIRLAKEKMMIGPGRGCFVPGSRVKMSDGLFSPIELVRVGDKVIDAHGVSQVVTDTLTYDVDEELLELVIDDGTIIRCTKDHEIFTVNRGYVKAQDLTHEDEIAEV
jgi:DNA polymerase-3 subunit alpha